MINEGTKKKAAGVAAVVVVDAAKVIKWVFINQNTFALLLTLGLMALSAVTGHAQGTGTGPVTVHGHSGNEPVRGVKIALMLFFWGLSGFGAYLIGKGFVDLGNKKGSIWPFAGGIGCLTIGGWIAMGNDIGIGNGPDLPDLLGN